MVSLELQLGAVCAGGVVMYDDVFFECGEQNIFISKEGPFTCGIMGTIPPNTGVEVPFAVASIETDFRWGMFGSDMCLSSAAPPFVIGGLLTSSFDASVIQASKRRRRSPTTRNVGGDQGFTTLSNSDLPFP